MSPGTADKAAPSAVHTPPPTPAAHTAPAEMSPTCRACIAMGESKLRRLPQRSQGARLTPDLLLGTPLTSTATSLGPGVADAAGADPDAGAA